MLFFACARVLCLRTVRLTALLPGTIIIVVRAAMEERERLGTEINSARRDRQQLENELERERMQREMEVESASRQATSTVSALSCVER